MTMATHLDLFFATTTVYDVLKIFKHEAHIRETAHHDIRIELSSLDEEPSASGLEDIAKRSLVEVVRKMYPQALILHLSLKEFLSTKIFHPEAAHHTLIDTYYQSQEGTGWATHSDDGYLYDNLAHHLFSAGKHDELYTLLTESPAWMNAKYAELAGDESYVADIDLALTHYQENTALSILRAGKLWAARTAVHGRLGTYSSQLLTSMVLIDKNIEKSGKRTRQAISHARLQPEVINRLDYLLKIYETLGQFSKEVVEELITLTSQLGGNEQARIYILEDIALMLVSAKGEQSEAAFTWALETGAQIQDDFSAHELLIEIAGILTRDGRLEQAIMASTQIKIFYDRAAALNEVALALNELDDPRTASILTLSLEAIETIEEASKRVLALTSVSVALFATGDSRMQDTFTRALDTLELIEDAHSRDQVRIEMIRILSKERLAEQILKLAAALEIDTSPVKVRQESLCALIAMGQVEQALETIAQEILVDHHGQQLEKVVGALAEAGYIEEAIATTLRIKESARHRVFNKDIIKAFAENMKANQVGIVVEYFHQTVKNDFHLGKLVQILDEMGQVEKLSAVMTEIERLFLNPLLVRGVSTSMIKSGQLEQVLTLLSQLDSIDQYDCALVEVTEALVSAGDIDQGLLLIAEFNSGACRKNALMNITEILSQAGDPRAVETWAAAFSANKSIESGWDRVQALDLMVKLYTDAGQMERAIALANQIAGRDRSQALMWIAAAFARSGDLEQALALHKQVIENDNRFEWLDSIVKALSEGGRTEEALQIAARIETPSTYGHALNYVVKALVASESIEKALEVATDIAHEPAQLDALITIMKKLTELGHIDRALQIATQIKDRYEFIRALSLIAGMLTETAHSRSGAMWAQVLEMAVQIEESSGRYGLLPSRDNLLTAIIEILVRVGQLEEATALIAQIKTLYGRAMAYDRIIMYLADSGRLEQAQTFAEQHKCSLSNHLLSSLAEASARAGDVETALHLLAQYDDVEDRVHAYSALARVRAEAGQLVGQHGAFTIYNPDDSIDFLNTMAEWAASFDAIEPGLSFRVLNETLCIFLWVRPSWQPIYDILQRADVN